MSPNTGQVINNLIDIIETVFDGFFYFPVLATFSPLHICKGLFFVLSPNNSQNLLFCLFGIAYKETN
jgi:hypothetical protein